MNPIKNVLAYRIAIAWFVMFSFNALATAIIAGLVDKDWSTMTVQNRFIVVVAIMANWTGTMMAFFSRAAKKIEDNPLRGVEPPKTP